jgi:hypothetical protein
MYCINRNRNMHKRILYMHCSETATVIYLFIRKDLKKRKIGHDRVRARHSLYWEVIFPIYNGVMAAMFKPGVHE